MCATFARDVVFPTPLIPTNRIRNGCCTFFFSFIRSKRSIFSVPSNSAETIDIKESRTNFSISFLSIFRPINFSFRSDFTESMTSIATSDSRRAISRSDKAPSTSFSFSSFSPRLFTVLENAPRSLSNISYSTFCEDWACIS